MADMQCPYCGADQDVCHDDGHGYAEGVRWEHTCSECEKSFVFQTSIVLYYEPAKADCLNGSEHTYKASKTWPASATRMRCTECDHERQPTDTEWADIHAAHQPAKEQAMTEELKPTARLEWSLYVTCPKCEESNDLADSQHDTEHEIARRIFNNDWDELKGREVTCEHCGHEFTIEKVEY